MYSRTHESFRERDIQDFRFIDLCLFEKMILRALQRHWGKVKLSLGVTKHCTMKAYGGVDVYIHVFLASTEVGGEWSASRSCRFTSGGNVSVSIAYEAGGPQNRSGRQGEVKIH
jgi:hypothetical protein